MTSVLDRSLAISPVPSLGSLLRTILSRFGFLYWTMFCVLIVFSNIGAVYWLSSVPGELAGALGVWLGKTVLAIPYDFSGEVNGSGDRTADWVLMLCIASLAAIGTVVWTLIAGRRADSARWHAGLRVAVRYTLAFSVLDYGIAKLFFGQFPEPGVSQLLERFGDASPMGLLWTFMGASPAYIFFSGLAETVGSALLLFRRTTLLGALVLAGVLTNVVLLNFCYDVPLKICSAHYLAMCIYLVLPDLRRLADLLVFNRAAAPAGDRADLPRRGHRIARRVVKYGAIGFVVFATTHTAIKEQPEGLVDDARAAWYGGPWQVTSFHRNGTEVPANRSEKTRWQRVRFQPDGPRLLFRWRGPDRAIRGDLYEAVIDERARTITLTTNEQINEGEPTRGPRSVVLSYVRLDDQHLQLEGAVGADTLSVQVEREDVAHMLLRTRGFRWINEAPFNR